MRQNGAKRERIKKSGEEEAETKIEFWLRGLIKKLSLKQDSYRQKFHFDSSSSLSNPYSITLILLTLHWRISFDHRPSFEHPSGFHIRLISFIVIGAKLAATPRESG